jgi:hypothetical protein
MILRDWPSWYNTRKLICTSYISTWFKADIRQSYYLDGIAVHLQVQMTFTKRKDSPHQYANEQNFLAVEITII